MNRYIIFIIIGLLLFFFSPQNYDYRFILLCLVIYVAEAIPALLFEFKSKKYISFNFLFFLSLFFTSFILPLTPIYQYASIDITADYINMATALVVLAFGTYSFGWYKGISKPSVLNYYLTQLWIPNKLRTIFHFLCILSTLLYLYFLRVFIQTMMGTTNDIGENYLITLIQTFFVISLIIDTKKFSQIKQPSFSKYCKFCSIPLTCSLIIIITSIMIIGDRTMPLFLILSITIIFIYYVHSIRLSYLVIGFVLGLSLFYTMGKVRGDNMFYGSDLKGVVGTTTKTVYETNDMNEFFQDFLPASQGLYLLLHWKKTNNDQYYYPAKIFILPFSPIPFVPSKLANLIYGVEKVGDLNSAKLATFIFNDKVKNTDSGLGTHPVGDIYVSFGLLGVIFIFYIFGYIVGYSQIKCTTNIYYSLIYITLCSDAFYIGRGTLFMDLRTIGFQVFCLWFLPILFNCKIKKYYSV